LHVLVKLKHVIQVVQLKDISVEINLVLYVMLTQVVVLLPML